MPGSAAHDACAALPADRLLFTSRAALPCPRRCWPPLSPWFWPFPSCLGRPPAGTGQVECGAWLQVRRCGCRHSGACRLFCQEGHQVQQRRQAAPSTGGLQCSAAGSLSAACRCDRNRQCTREPTLAPSAASAMRSLAASALACRVSFWAWERRACARDGSLQACTGAASQKARRRETAAAAGREGAGRASGTALPPPPPAPPLIHWRLPWRHRRQRQLPLPSCLWRPLRPP